MRLSDWKVGDAVECDFSVSDADMRAFAALSGDHNPIHSSAKAATELGFERPVVYGGLLVARVSEMLGMRMPGAGCVWLRLEMSFVHPLYVGDVARLKGTIVALSAAVRLLTIQHVITRGVEVIARGKSEARIHE